MHHVFQVQPFQITPGSLPGFRRVQFYVEYRRAKQSTPSSQSFCTGARVHVVLLVVLIFLTNTFSTISLHQQPLTVKLRNTHQRQRFTTKLDGEVRFIVQFVQWCFTMRKFILQENSPFIYHTNQLFVQKQCSIEANATRTDIRLARLALRRCYRVIRYD